MYVLLAVIFAAVIVIFKLASVIFGILYMHYDALHKNKRLSASWYVCGFFFSFLDFNSHKFNLLYIFLIMVKTFSPFS